MLPTGQHNKKCCRKFFSLKRNDVDENSDTHKVIMQSTRNDNYVDKYKRLFF